MELTATISTNRGDVTVELLPQVAPLTVANFANLALRGYYDGLKFHRVIADFMVQGGDPTGTGSGGPGYQFKDECTAAARHDGPGTLSMANAGPGTNGSQFFITHVKTDWLDGKHTVFGRVVSGQEIVNAIRQGDTMTRISVHGDTGPVFSRVEKELARWNKVLDQKFPAHAPSGRA